MEKVKVKLPKVDVPTKSWLIDRTTYIGKVPLWFRRGRRKIDRKRDVFK